MRRHQAPGGGGAPPPGTRTVLSMFNAASDSERRAGAACCLVRALHEARCTLCWHRRRHTRGSVACAQCAHVFHIECLEECFPPCLDTAGGAREVYTRLCARGHAHGDRGAGAEPAPNDVPDDVLEQCARDVRHAAAHLVDVAAVFRCAWCCHPRALGRVAFRARQRRAEESVLHTDLFPVYQLRDPFLVRQRDSLRVRHADIVPAPPDDDDDRACSAPVREAHACYDARYAATPPDTVWRVWWLGVPAPCRATRTDTALVHASHHRRMLCSCMCSVLVPEDCHDDTALRERYGTFHGHWPWVVFDLDFRAHRLPWRLVERWTASVPAARVHAAVRAPENAIARGTDEHARLAPATSPARHARLRAALAAHTLRDDDVPSLAATLDIGTTTLRRVLAADSDSDDDDDDDCMHVV